MNPETQLAVPAEPDILWAPLSDQDIEDLANQDPLEPLPPNQIYQLPATEPTNENPITYIHTHEHK